MIFRHFAVRNQPSISTDERCKGVVYEASLYFQECSCRLAPRFTLSDRHMIIRSHFSAYLGPTTSPIHCHLRTSLITTHGLVFSEYFRPKLRNGVHQLATYKLSRYGSRHSPPLLDHESSRYADLHWKSSGPAYSPEMPIYPCKAGLNSRLKSTSCITQNYFVSGKYRCRGSFPFLFYLVPSIDCVLLNLHLTSNL